MKPDLFIIMGVSGCGKSTVGRALAAKLGCPFYDGDDYHPPANVAKMAGGVPLDDADRRPWLLALRDLLAGQRARGEMAVLACSALKRSYRDLLRLDEDVCFVHLAGSFELIWARMSARSDHYMKPAMLRSQFDDLEAPAAGEAIVVDVALPVDEILALILTRTGRPPRPAGGA